MFHHHKTSIIEEWCTARTIQLSLAKQLLDRGHSGRLEGKIWILRETIEGKKTEVGLPGEGSDKLFTVERLQFSKKERMTGATLSSIKVDLGLEGELLMSSQEEVEAEIISTQAKMKVWKTCNHQRKASLEEEVKEDHWTRETPGIQEQGDRDRITTSNQKVKYHWSILKMPGQEEAGVMEELPTSKMLLEELAIVEPSTLNSKVVLLSRSHKDSQMRTSHRWK